MKLLIIFVFVIFLVVGSTADAAVVTFNLVNNGDASSDSNPEDDVDAFDFGDSIGSYTDPSGLKADFTAIVAGSSGDLNATSTAFGVNAVNGFIPENPSDDTSQLDADQGAESFTIAFSGPVSATLTQVDIGSFGTNDTGTLDIGGISTVIDSGTTTLIPAHTELVGNLLTIAFTAGTVGNGFSVNSLTFEVVAVPEPSSAMLLAVIGVFGPCFCSRRRRRN